MSAALSVPHACPDSASAERHFVVMKMSAQGVAYYFKGGVNLVETADPKFGSMVALVAETGLLLGDAYRFESHGAASEAANLLDLRGIGGAQWLVGVV